MLLHSTPTYPEHSALLENSRSSINPSFIDLVIFLNVHKDRTGEEKVGVHGEVACSNQHSLLLIPVVGSHNIQ